MLVWGLATLLLGACSSDDLVTDDGGGKGNGQEGKALVAMKISIPVSGAGMAGRADSYVDGESYEFAVKNMSVLIFDKNTKKLERIYSTLDNSLAEPSWTTDASNAQITQTAKLPACAVENTQPKDLFIVLNSRNIEALKGIVAEEDVENYVLTDDAALYASKEETGTGFLMCNAALWKSGTGGGVQTFVSVEPQETREAAEDESHRANIYVERLVGKVSLTHANTGAWNAWKYTVPEDGSSASAGAEITMLDYILDVTNKSSYLLHRTDEAAGWFTDTYKYKNDQNRFYGPAPIEDDLYRINYAVDPNYDEFATSDFTVNSTFPETGVGLDKPSYCYENTFDVKNQRRNRTTRVLLKANFRPKGFDENETWFTIGPSDVPLHAEAAKTRIENAVNGLADVEEDAVITVEIAQMSGENDFDDNVKIDGVNLSDTQKTALQTALGDVKAYKDGICYYVVRVKHFGDAETPWGSDDAPGIGTPDTKYWAYGSEHPDANENKYYLGRYGIVRNNWYELSLNKVSAPGSCQVLKLESTIDDEHNYYIDASVKILSWKKRKQDVNL